MWLIFIWTLCNLVLCIWIWCSIYKIIEPQLTWITQTLIDIIKNVEPISKIEQEQKELSDNYTYTSYTYRRLIPRKKIHKNLSIFGRGKKMFRN